MVTVMTLQVFNNCPGWPLAFPLSVDASMTKKKHLLLPKLFTLARLKNIWHTKYEILVHFHVTLNAACRVEAT